MGTTLNGIYIPDNGENNWGSQVSANFTRQADEVNVKAFGAVGDGVSDDSAAIQAAITAAGAGEVYFPSGTYFLAEGSTIAPAIARKFRGEGARSSVISSKNAYALTAPATGPLDNVTIQHMGFTLRSGSTSGGAIKAVSNSYHSNWRIFDCEATGVSTSTDPVYWFDGLIGSWVERCQGTGGGGHMFLLDTTGFASNVNHVIDCRAQSTSMTTTSAGFYINGTGNTVLDRCTAESLNGYGVYLNGCTWPVVRGCWFESNNNDNLRIVDTTGAQVYDNKFTYQTGGTPAAVHIKCTASVSSARSMHTIVNNFFQNTSTSGVYIDMDDNVRQCWIAHNRGLGYGSSALSVTSKYNFIVANDINATNGTDTSVFPTALIVGRDNGWFVKAQDGQVNDQIGLYNGSSSTTVPRVKMGNFILDGNGAAMGIVGIRQDVATNPSTDGGGLFFPGNATREVALGVGNGSALSAKFLVQATAIIIKNGVTILAFRDNAASIWFGTADDVKLSRNAASVLAMEPNGAGLQFTENGTTDLAAGATNTARLYVKDNGAGKSQLCVRFNTGAVQVIATEP